MTAIPRLAERASARLGLLVGLLVVFAAFAATPVALGAADEFGIESVSSTLSTTEAGRHPDVVNQIKFKPSATSPVGDIDSLLFQFPAGLLGNRQNIEECPLQSFSNPFLEPCPVDSQVGTLTFNFYGFPPTEVFREPIYNLPPGEGEFIRLGFIGVFFPTYVGFSLRSDGDYGVTVRSSNIASYTHIETITAKVWGVPADPSHDTERLTPLEAFFCASQGGVPCEHGGSRESTAIPVPFMSNPTSCQPMPFGYETTTYLLPGQVFKASASAPDITDCDKVPFEPSLSFDTTNHKAGAPTGLEATLKIPQNEGVSTINSSTLRSARVELPDGMTVNAAAADGLAGCTAAEAGLGVRGPGQCPSDSKLGAATFVSPNLERPMEGGIYLRTPAPGHLFRFWLISNDLGVNLKVAGEVQLDPDTGRLTAVIPQAPQLPAEEIVLRFNGGPRAAVRNPLSCGTLNAAYELAPWSGNPPATGTAPITVNEGCNTGGFDPKLSAGTMDPSAGHFSPFLFDLKR
ncbi:MAG TPA: hypothetical protein VN732_11010, partial [Solirubrobacterales bacterium]|nr:hypothetical protein [Solirubrobacterales bacterium]